MDERTRWIDHSGLAALRAAPMPSDAGPEPDELALRRTQKYIEEGRFDALSRDE